MLTYFGAEISVKDEDDGRRAVTVRGDAELGGASIAIPGDPSSAAFAIAAALICEGSNIVLEGVLMNPTRAGFIETVREMGGDVELLDLRLEGGEPAADFRVRAGALSGVDVPPGRAPSMKTLGVKVEEVKSGPLKAVPNPFEPTDEKGRALAAEMVQEAKVWFVDLVGKRRNLEPAAVPGLTDGRVYSGRQALALKLVDEIGDERAAKRWLQEKRDVTPGLSVVEWKPRTESGGIWGWLFGSIASSFGIAADNFVSLFGQVSEGLRLDGLVSLWHPAGS